MRTRVGTGLKGVEVVSRKNRRECTENTASPAHAENCFIHMLNLITSDSRAESAVEEDDNDDDEGGDSQQTKDTWIVGHTGPGPRRAGSAHFPH